jgi:hypothetical protein
MSLLDDEKVEYLASFPADIVWKMAEWPASGSEDIELGVLMEPEVCHGAAEVYTRVQA